MNNNEIAGVQADEAMSGIVLADVESYNSIVRELGEVRSLSTLHQFSERSSHLLKSHGARVAKSTGDGFLAVFDNPTDAVDFALSLQRSLTERPIRAGNSAIQVRIAVHAGQVSVRETEYGRDAFGSAIAHAAHIEPLCRPGEIIVSESVHRLLSPVRVRTFSHRREVNLRHGTTAIVWEGNAENGVAVEERE